MANTHTINLEKASYEKTSSVNIVGAAHTGKIIETAIEEKIAEGAFDFLEGKIEKFDSKTKNQKLRNVGIPDYILKRTDGTILPLDAKTNLQHVSEKQISGENLETALKKWANLGNSVPKGTTEDGYVLAPNIPLNREYLKSESGKKLRDRVILVNVDPIKELEKRRPKIYRAVKLLTELDDAELTFESIKEYGNKSMNIIRIMAARVKGEEIKYDAKVLTKQADTIMEEAIKEFEDYIAIRQLPQDLMSSENLEDYIISNAKHMFSRED